MTEYSATYWAKPGAIDNDINSPLAVQRPCTDQFPGRQRNADSTPSPLHVSTFPTVQKLSFLTIQQHTMNPVSTCKYGSASVFGHVCPVVALTFESLDLETSFLVRRISRSSWYVKAVESRSRSQQQKMRYTNVSTYTHLWVVRLWITGNMLYIQWFKSCQTQLEDNTNIKSKEIKHC